MHKNSSASSGFEKRNTVLFSNSDSLFISETELSLS